MPTNALAMSHNELGREVDLGGLEGIEKVTTKEKATEQEAMCRLADGTGQTLAKACIAAVRICSRAL